MPIHPVEGGQKSPRWALTWQGKRVAFCCEDCVDAWKGMTDQDRSKALSDADISTKTPSP